MARLDESNKRGTLVRRRTIGRLRLAAVVFVLGCTLGAALAGIVLRAGQESGDDVSPYVLMVAPEEGAPIPRGAADF
ncbi:MAG: hypothetical protein ACREDF_06605, partial [Thermoplasmata archaeon]